MQTQDSQLRQIHEDNKEVKKKLQMFRSGLQKLMNKKSISKKQSQQPLQRYQTPSRDNITNHQLQSFLLQQQQQPIINSKPQQNKLTPYKTSPYNFQSPSPSQQQQQFGFNSTLFRQINDETVMSNISSSGVFIGSGSVGQVGIGVDYYQGVVGMRENKSNNGLQDVKNGSNAYFDSSNNKSITIPTINFNNQQQFHHKPQQQPFKKSSLLFKQIDQLINKVNKTTKLPIKPIQKYINQQEFQQQEKLISDRGDSMEIQLTLSSSRVEANVEDGWGKSGRSNKGKLSDVGKQANVNANKVASSSTLRKDTLLLKQANDFLKNMRQKSSSLTIQQGKPPLPQQAPIPKSTIATKTADKLIQLNSNNKTNQQPLRIQQQILVIKQPITLKIKQTLSQRKKLMRQQPYHQRNNIILMDDSIELQLSSEDEKQYQQDIIKFKANNKNIQQRLRQSQQQNQIQQDHHANRENQRQIQQLIDQRCTLLEQLQRIQKQLQQLQQQQ